MLTYSLVLPMPTSLNALYVPTRNGIQKTSEWKTWNQLALISFRKQFGYESLKQITGRIRAQYLCIKTNGRDYDAANLEKALSDFLQKKFFDNDSQIDEMQIFKRFGKHGQSRVRVWLTEIPDERYIDTMNCDDARWLV